MWYTNFPEPQECFLRSKYLQNTTWKTLFQKTYTGSSFKRHTMDLISFNNLQKVTKKSNILSRPIEHFCVLISPPYENLKKVIYAPVTSRRSAMDRNLQKKPFQKTYKRSSFRRHLRWTQVCRKTFFHKTYKWSCFRRHTVGLIAINDLQKDSYSQRKKAVLNILS